MISTCPVHVMQSAKSVGEEPFDPYFLDLFINFQYRLRGGGDKLANYPGCLILEGTRKTWHFWMLNNDNDSSFLNVFHVHSTSCI